MAGGEKTLAALTVKIGANIEAFQSGLTKAEKRLAKMERNFKRVGQNMTRNLTAPIGALGALAAKTFIGFEQQMANVQAVSGASADQFKKLSDNAKELGKSTTFSAAQVAELQLNYSKLGFAPEEINKITKSTLELSQATGEDLASSATVAGSTLRGFGLDASKMQMVTDVMAKSFSSSALDLEKFKTAMGAVAPVAKNANVDIQKTTAYLSVLVDRGIDASTAGTGLRNMFLEVSKKGISMQQALDQINNATDKNAVALELFGKRGATVAAILAENQGAVNSLSNTYLKAGGAAKAMADVMTNTVQGKIQLMMSSIEGLGIAFGELLKPAIEKFTITIGHFADKLSSLDERQRKTILTIAGIVAAIGPAIFAFSKIVGMVKGVIGAMKVLNSVMLANPWVLVAAAVAALAVYFVKLWKTSETFRAKTKYVAESVSVFFQKSWISIQRGAELMWLGIKTYFTAIPKAAAAIWKAVKRAMKGEKLGEVLAEEFGNIVANVSDTATTIKDKYNQQLAAIQPPNYEEILAAEKAMEVAQDTGEKAAKAFQKGMATGGNGGGRAKMPAMGKMETKSVSTVSGGAGFGDAMELEVDKIQEQSDRLYNVATQMKATLGKVFIDLGQMISDALSDAFATLGESIGSLAAGQSTMGDVFKNMLGVVLDFTSALGKALIAAGIGKMSFDKLLSVGGGPLAIAAGTALIALSGAVKGIMSNGLSGGGSESGGAADGGGFQSVPALASGGIATKPTIAMIGDSKNSMPNREAIVPLSKMNGMFGNVHVTGTLRASGRELIAVIESENKRVNTVK